MNELKKPYTLPVYIKGAVFAIVLIFFTTSCCITGYCPVTQDIPQREEAKEK